MESSRWKTASLAINAIIRGLELDQIAFRYDEAASPEFAGLEASALLRELSQRKEPKAAARP